MESETKSFDEYIETLEKVLNNMDLSQFLKTE